MFSILNLEKGIPVSNDLKLSSKNISEDISKWDNTIQRMSLELENDADIYVRPGRKDIAPIIAFGGTGSRGYADIKHWKTVLETLYGAQGLPFMYSMDYYANGFVSEELLIQNGCKLFEYVCRQHGKRPHVMGMSLGSAVGIGVIDRMGCDTAASLTVLDPFTSYPDTVAGIFRHSPRHIAKRIHPRLAPIGNVIGCMAWIFGYIGGLCIRLMGRDVWDSEKRISGPIFKDLPILVLSGKNDQLIAPEIHNQIYAAAAHLPKVPQVTEDWNYWKVSGSDLKVLLESNAGHMSIYSYGWILKHACQLKDFKKVPDFLSRQHVCQLTVLQKFLQNHIRDNNQSLGSLPKAIHPVPTQWVNYSWMIPSLLIAMSFVVSYVRKTFTVEVVYHEADPIAAIV